MANKRRIAKAYATKVGQVTYVTLRKKGLSRRKAGRVARSKSRKTYRWAMRKGRRPMRRMRRYRRIRRYRRFRR